MKWHPELYFTWGDSSIRRICLAKMSIRPKRTQFCWKMLCFQQLTQLNLVIAVENTPTRASAFNLSDPAVVVNERAVTSRHRNEEYSSNPHFVSGSSGCGPLDLLTWALNIFCLTYWLYWLHDRHTTDTRAHVASVAWLWLDEECED